MAIGKLNPARRGLLAVSLFVIAAGCSSAPQQAHAPSLHSTASPVGVQRSADRKQPVELNARPAVRSSLMATTASPAFRPIEALTVESIATSEGSSFVLFQADETARSIESPLFTSTAAPAFLHRKRSFNENHFAWQTRGNRQPMRPEFGPLPEAVQTDANY